MNKQIIIDLLNEKHHSFINYIHGLTADEYLYSYQQKWSAAQQLEHIVLCVKPIVQVFSMDSLTIQNKFGLSDRASLTYDVLLTNYKEKLKEGGKAPDRYVPETISLNNREILIETLTNLLQDLCSKIEHFTEQDLDLLLIPHPLLGNLTMREMLYNTIFHVEHHHKLAKEYLKVKPS